MANNIINTEVIGDFITEKLGNNVKFLPLAKVVEVNQQAGAVAVYKEAYIGDAQMVAPGQLIPASDFNQEKVLLEIGKLAQRVIMTEEERLSGAGNPAEKVSGKLLTSLEKGLDKALVAKLAGITGAMVHDATVAGAVTKEVLADALAKFGEDQEGIYLMVGRDAYTAMRKNNDFIIKSVEGGLNIVGEVYGVDVILSENVPAGEAYLLKAGAVHLYIRKEAQVQADLDIETQVNVFVGTVYMGAILADESGAVKIDLQA